MKVIERGDSFPCSGRQHKGCGGEKPEVDGNEAGALWRVRGKARGFYETAGAVKVFVLAFVFPSLAFLFLPLLLPLLVSFIHLGLLSALWVNRLGFGACWCPMTMKGRCYLKRGLLGQATGRSRRNASLVMHFGKSSFLCCFASSARPCRHSCWRCCLQIAERLAMSCL